MAKKDRRFTVVHEEGSGLTISFTILRDNVTGVLYLFTKSGYGGGLTPLLDAQGKPVKELPEKGPEL